MMQEKPLYSLIPLEDFKTLLGVDDRDDKMSRFCLVTATLTIERHCRRRLLRKKIIDYHQFTGDHIFALREYPVRKVASVYAAGEKRQVSNDQGALWDWEMVDPGIYYCLPDAGICEDIPFSLVLRPPLRFSREKMTLKILYSAGYSPGKVPADLASACLELAAWNMNRYRGRRIGMTGTVRGNGKDGEHLEMSMPSNVCNLLEPYKRKVI